jgi:hypothetical protein
LNDSKDSLEREENPIAELDDKDDALNDELPFIPSE